MKAIVVLLLTLLAGCAASGSKFEQIQSFSDETTTIYVMRQWAFGGGATCPDIYLNGKEIGCLKNGGFIRAEVPSGAVYFRADYFSDNDYETFNTAPGEIVYIEWYYNVGADGYSYSYGLDIHEESTALKILKSLRESE